MAELERAPTGLVARLQATPCILEVKMDNEIIPCYDEASIEKGRGLGTLTTLRPTSNRPTFLGQPFFPSF